MIDADRCGKARRSNVKEHKLPWPHGISMATRQLVGQCLEVAQPFYVYQRQPELYSSFYVSTLAPSDNCKGNTEGWGQSNILVNRGPL